MQVDGRNTLYTPLSRARAEIRLLEVLPGSPDQSVNCNVRIVSLLDQHLRFAALSYVWGDAKDTRDVILNGHTVSVTVSLSEALDTIRRRGVPEVKFAKGWASVPGDDAVSTKEPDITVDYRPDKTWDGVSWLPPGHPETLLVWADAICINQSDPREKSHQVAMMARIYSAASLVLSWIDPTETTQIALQTFRNSAREVLECLRTKSGNQSLYDALTKLLPSLMLGIASPPAASQNHGVGSGNRQWDAINTFAHHRYFQRIWIRQEVALAPSLVFFGTREHCRVDDLSLFMVKWLIQAAMEVSFARPSRRVSPELWSNLKSLFRSLEYTPVHETLRLRSKCQKSHGEADGANFSIDYVENLCRTASATDARDCVYGVLGVIDRGSPGTRLQPDYSKSKREVYLEWALELSRSREPFRFLQNSGIGLSPEPSPDLPSWLVDLAQAKEYRDSPSDPALYYSDTHMKAIKRYQDLLRPPGQESTSRIHEDGTLEYRGIEIAKVTDYIEHMPKIDMLGENGESMLMLLNTLINFLACNSGCLTSQSIEAVIWLLSASVRTYQMAWKPTENLDTDVFLEPNDEDTQGSKIDRTEGSHTSMTRRTSQLDESDISLKVGLIDVDHDDLDLLNTAVLAARADDGKKLWRCLYRILTRRFLAKVQAVSAAIDPTSLHRGDNQDTLVTLLYEDVRRLGGSTLFLASLDVPGSEHIGQGPLGMRPGDMIFATPDLKFYLVLRKREEGPHGDHHITWNYVGACQIPTITPASVEKLLQAGKLQPQSFSII